MRRLIIWGAGELGGRVAQLWRDQQGEVIAFTKTETRHEALRAMGIEPRLGEPSQVLQTDDVLLLTLPGHTIQKIAIEALENTSPPVRAVLISSTGYYGLPKGIVTEDTRPGESERAQAIAATEQAFLDWAGEKGVVIRFGGLYRSGRGPYSVLKRRGYPILGAPNKSLALIHYDDAAKATATALQHPNPAKIYLGVIPPCPTREAFYQQACAKLGLPSASFDTPLPHPPAQYDVSRLRQDLLPDPVYPDWQAALEE